jgi:hypothetical protein
VISVVLQIHEYSIYGRQKVTLHLYLQMYFYMRILIFIYFVLQVSVKEVTLDEEPHMNVRMCEYK